MDFFQIADFWASPIFYYPFFNFLFLITEAVLETLKRIKPIIDQSKSGFKGQSGPPGPKGDPAPMPSGPISE